MKKTGKDALLAWCKNKTQGYRGVEVTNFSSSWKDGLAMCALVHSVRPDLIPWDTLNRADELGNHNLAYNAAETFGVPKLLDAEDMTPGPPEPFSVTTYLGTFYHAAQKIQPSGGASTQSPATPAAQATPKRPSAGATAAIPPTRSPASHAPATPPRTASQAPPQTPSVTQGPNCSKCNNPASGMMVNWNDNLYHQDCFKCAGCSRPFRKTCLNIEGLPYCDGCGRRAFIQSRLLRHGLNSADDTPERKPTPASPANNTPSRSPSQSTTANAPAQPPLPAKNPSNSGTSQLSVPSTTSSTSVSPNRSPATSTSTATTPARSPAGSTNSTSSTASKPITSTASTSSSVSSSQPKTTTTASGPYSRSASSNSSSSVATKTSSPATSAASLRTASASSNIAKNTAAEPAPAKKESILEKEMREQREKEAELEAARARARGTTVSSPAAPPQFASNTAASSSEAKITAPAKVETPTAATIASPKTSAAPPATQLSTTKATTTDKSPEKPKPTTTGATSSPSITQNYMAGVKASAPSTTSKPATAAPKGESIIEREMREQREKEEALERDRQKAIAVHQPTVAASATSAPVPTKTPSTPAIVEKKAEPAPALPARTDSSAVKPSAATAAAPPQLPPKTDSAPSNVVTPSASAAPPLPVRSESTSVATGPPALPARSDSSPLDPPTLPPREQAPVVPVEPQAAPPQLPPKPSDANQPPALPARSDSSSLSKTTAAPPLPAKNPATAAPTQSGPRESSTRPSNTPPMATTTKPQTKPTTLPSSTSSASKADEERRRAEEAEKAFLSSNKPRHTTIAPQTKQEPPAYRNRLVSAAPAVHQQPKPAPELPPRAHEEPTPPTSNQNKAGQTRPSRPPTLPPPNFASHNNEATSSAPPLPPRSDDIASQPPSAPSSRPTLLPPAPSRYISPVASTYEPIASSSAATTEYPDHFAEDVAENVENEDVEVSARVRRATTTVVRVNVAKVQEGHQGWLKRRDRSNTIKLFWSTSWFSLQEFRLLYYKEEQYRHTLASDNPPEGFLSLQFVDVIRMSTSSERQFVVEGPAFKWDLKAETREAALDWVQALTDAQTMFNLTERHKRRTTSNPVFGQDHAEDMVMEGYLERLAVTGYFNRNYWILQDGMLFYFSSRGGKRLGRIPLYHCEFTPYEMTKSSTDAIRAFEITTHTGEKVILAAENEMEMHRWLNCMLRQRIVIEEAIDMISF